MKADKVTLRTFLFELLIGLVTVLTLCLVMDGVVAGLVWADASHRAFVPAGSSQQISGSDAAESDAQ